MRVFLAGATGLIGSRLVPLLIAAGHEVTAMTRSAAKREVLSRQGADTVVVDVYDRDRLIEAVTTARPEMVMHQLTDLPDDPSALATATEANARIRVEGTDNLLEAARRSGATRFFAQSIAWRPSSAAAQAAVDHLESAVLGFGGTVARYGQFYGPDTYHPEPPSPPRIHIDAAARRTVELVDAPPGLYDVVEEGET